MLNNREVIVAGQVSSAAWRYLESHGAQLEEVKGLVFINLPRSAEVQHWSFDEVHHIASWSITFDDDDTEDKQHIIIEVEVRTYESRVFALSI